jgi:hypothetical protein
MKNGDNADDFFLEPEPIDPKKLFNEEEYSTLIVNREGFDKKQNDTADLIESLFEKKLTRQEFEQIIEGLKKANAQKMLVDAIEGTNNVHEQTVLAQAAWESGLDFSTHFMFFVSLACSSDAMLSLEALTVIESTETKIESDVLMKAISIASNSTNINSMVKEDLLINLQSRLES